MENSVFMIAQWEIEYNEKCQILAKGFLFCVFRFIASGGKQMSALAGFVRSQGSGFSRSAAHENEDLYKFSAFGAADFHKTGCTFAFLAAFNQHNWILQSKNSVPGH